MKPLLDLFTQENIDYEKIAKEKISTFDDHSQKIINTPPFWEALSHLEDIESKRDFAKRIYYVFEDCYANEFNGLRPIDPISKTVIGEHNILILADHKGWCFDKKNIRLTLNDKLLNKVLNNKIVDEILDNEILNEKDKEDLIVNVVNIDILNNINDIFIENNINENIKKKCLNKIDKVLSKTKKDNYLSITKQISYILLEFFSSVEIILNIIGVLMIFWSEYSFISIFWKMILLHFSTLLIKSYLNKNI